MPGYLKTDPTLTLAFSKLADEKSLREARETLGKGTFPVDRKLHIKGVLTIGEPVLEKPTRHFLSLATFAFVLARAGIQREKALEILKETAEKVISGHTTFEEQLRPQAKAYDEVIREIEKMVESLPRIDKNGSASFSGIVEVLEKMR